MKSLLDRASKWIVDRRRGVQIVIAGVALAAAFGVADLRFELSPEGLVAEEGPPTGPEARRRAAHAAAFEGDERVLLVVVSGHDVLTDEALAYQHSLASWLAARPWVSHVDSLTTAPIPHRVKARKPTLADLETDDEDFPLPLGPEAEALALLAAEAPTRFPGGLGSIVDGWDDRPLEIAALVAGAAPTLADGDLIREVAADRGLFSRRMVARNRSAALIAATLTTATDRETEAAVHELRAHLGDTPPPEGLRVSPAGLPYLGTRLVEALETDWEALIMLACLGSFAVLAFGFRSLAGIVLPLAAVGISLAIVTGSMGYLGLPIDLLTNVIPPLLITIGLGDAIHLLHRYREERHRGQSPLSAARQTMSTMAVACFMTSATTAIGFGSLIISETEVLRRFGAIAGGAVMVAYLVTVLFLPSALPAFPREESAHRQPKGGRTVDRLVMAVACFAMRSPVAVLGLTAVLFVAFIAGAANVTVDGALLDQFDGSSDVRETTLTLEESLGGVRSFYVVADAGEGMEEGASLTRPILDELDAIAAELRHEEGVLRVTTPGDVLRETWALVTRDPDSASDAFDTRGRIEALAAVVRSTATHDPGHPGHAAHEGHPSAFDRFASPDGRFARVEVRLQDRGIRHLNAIFDRLEWRLGTQNAMAGFIAGEAHRASRGLDRVISDLLASLALAVVVIFVLVGVLFRSPRLALVSVPPNIIPLAAVLAWMGLRGLSLNASTVIVFGVSIGLAVDGTIHVLTRFREERRRNDSTAAAIEAAIAGSGRAVALSSAAVLLGFLALQVSGFLPVRLFGELSIVAVLAALIAELTVLPALLMLTMRGGKTR
ncbi:MAG: MMPL family transporter [Deltaproteobacteria bacterium]|nr:MMPL family transporter [Deltaproteobacteria bacterium]